MALRATCDKLCMANSAGLIIVVFLQKAMVVHGPYKKVSRTMFLVNMIHFYLQVTVSVLTEDDITHDLACSGAEGASYVVDDVEHAESREDDPHSTEHSKHAGVGFGLAHFDNNLLTNSSNPGSVFGVIFFTSLQDLQAYLLQYYDGEAPGLNISMVRNFGELDNPCDAARAWLGGGKYG